LVFLRNIGDKTLSLKKGLAIIFLIVFLFNVGGYYIVFWGLRFQSDQRLTARVQANLYDKDEIVELKIPVALPYPIHAQGFQPADGRFEHNGQHFKLIKHKFENDTLYVVCIRDYETRQLVNTIRDYVELTHGFDGKTSGQKALNILSKLVKDFYPEAKTIITHQYSHTGSLSFAPPSENIISPTMAIDSPPPRG